MYNEIIGVLGKEREPTHEDLKNLFFTEMFIKEGTNNVTFKVTPLAPRNFSEISYCAEKKVQTRPYKSTAEKLLCELQVCRWRHHKYGTNCKLDSLFETRAHL